MSKSNDRNLFEELRDGLQEIRAFNSGRTPLRTHRVAEPDVAAIRTKMSLTQDEFAALIGVSSRTLQNWEQGHRRPRGPARALLMIAAADPRAALRALHGRRV